jgi:hypothetical protein
MGEISVLLTRNAGAGQRVSAQMTFAQTDHDIPQDATVTLLIDDQDRGTLEAKDDSHFRFDSSQTAALIQALEHDSNIEIALNGQRKPLSSAGSSAVFLKIDEFQQRLGTADALVRKGDADDDNTLSAVAAPEIIAAPTIRNAQSEPLTAKQRQKLLPELIPLLNSHCDDWQNKDIPSQERQITTTPLDKTHSLIEALCWRAAYNDGYAMWVVENTRSPNHSSLPPMHPAMPMARSPFSIRARHRRLRQRRGAGLGRQNLRAESEIHDRYVS